MLRAALFCSVCACAGARSWACTWACLQGASATHNAGSRPPLHAASTSPLLPPPQATSSATSSRTRHPCLPAPWACSPPPPSPSRVRRWRCRSPLCRLAHAACPSCSAALRPPPSAAHLPNRIHPPNRRHARHLRAGARLRARHCGPGQGQPARHDPLRRHDVPLRPRPGGRRRPPGGRRHRRHARSRALSASSARRAACAAGASSALLCQALLD